MTDKWKEVAWNGIRFKVPADWEPVQIGFRYLLFENETGPVMEIKWGPVEGRFSHRTQLKRLAAQHGRKLKKTFAEWFLPPHWQRALSAFETSGFLWQGEGVIGRGAILFCPVCRTAALIQFMGSNSAPREAVVSTVLRSYRDHRRDGRILWSIFDMRAGLAQDLNLTDFRFEAGKFELGFTHPRQRVYLHRWAPAAVLLGENGLVGFAATIPDFPTGEPRMLTINGFSAVEWSLAPRNEWQRRISRVKRGPSFFHYRLWHAAAQNRIVGVRAESKFPLDFDLLNRICADYEIV